MIDSSDLHLIQRSNLGQIDGDEFSKSFQKKKKRPNLNSVPLYQKNVYSKVVNCIQGHNLINLNQTNEGTNK
jgi:hypothetical protein